MDSALRLPIDLLQLPSFRQLKTRFGLERSLLIWFVLWQELRYRAQEGNCPGRLPAAEVPVVLAALSIAEPDESAQREIFNQIVASGLLKPDGQDFVCPRFALLHGAEPNRSQAQKGGDMRAYTQRMKKAAGQTFQQSLLISETKLVDEEGQPLPAEEVKRVMRLIVACDNALFKPNRPPFGYTEGLIQEARAVLKRFTDEEIDLVCRTVALHRNHPSLNGVTTERLLPMFAEVAKKLEAA
jgi:hypothetical protein